MKISIGPYPHWYSTMWMDNWYSNVRFKKHDYMVEEDEKKWFDRAVYGFINFLQWLIKPLNKFNQWRGRRVKVKIHNYDSWNADATLALIILPILKQLKATKHGAPFVDDADVPEELRSTNAPPKEHEHDIDDLHFKRWDWVMDEMIWAFAQMTDESEGEDQFYTGESDTWMQAYDKDHNKIGEPQPWMNKFKGEGIESYQIVDGPNHTRKCDYEGMTKHHERIRNGTRLFGTYYRGLWD
jgi:hypothetical protein